MKYFNKSLRRTRFHLILFFVVGLCSLQAATVNPQEKSAKDPVLVPFVVDAVRQPTTVSGQLLVYNGAEEEFPMQLRALRVIIDSKVIVKQRLDVELPGDPRYGELSALQERLPKYLTGRHRPRGFASSDAPQFTGDEIERRYHEIGELLADLKRDYADPKRRPFLQVKFELPLAKIFNSNSKPGDIATVVFEVDYLVSWETARTAKVTHSLRFLGPLPGVPSSLMEVGDFSVHAGDLHVHSCHGEALDACEPSENCLAETLEIAGSFSLAELKSQYQALGLDWYTSTDHSYCINSDSEYLVIADEAAALTDSTFIVYPDTELSSDEKGPQTGLDLGDLLCLKFTRMNHMGAHGITSRKPGGDDGLFGFCNRRFSDALQGFVSNVEDIRAEGGYPVIKHPAELAFAWNSIILTGGIESNMFHGVEIWNGPFRSGQGDHVKRWTDWLLHGRILYGYSGSDTHDAAFEFGANHALLEDSFTAENLKSTIMAGRIYVSNGHFLVITLDGANGTLLMGDVELMPSEFSSDVPVEISAHYDFAEDTATITIFRGRVGEAEESVLCTSAPLTDSGVFTCTDTVHTTSSSYYRAYSEDSSVSTTAYTNPIFLLGSS